MVVLVFVCLCAHVCGVCVCVCVCFDACQMSAMHWQACHVHVERVCRYFEVWKCGIPHMKIGGP